MSNSKTKSKKKSKTNSKTNSKTKSKKSSKSLNLYNDLNPKTTIQGTGYSDTKSAEKTLDLIKSRSLGYQFNVVNTMYNRAKYHPNQTTGMKDAIKIYHKWIKQYNKKKEKENIIWPFLSLDVIKSYETLAEKYKISKVARGLVKGSKTDQGFFKILSSVSHPNKLQYIPVKQNNPKGQDYWSYRISFLKSRLGQMKALGTPLFYSDGKYKNLPTKQHVILILHGFSPLGKTLQKYS